MKIPSDTFCIVPWMHLNTDAHFGKGKICCLEDQYLQNGLGHWQDSDGLDSYFNCEEYKKVRLQMLRGIRPKNCLKGCFNLEDAGSRSFRQMYNEQYCSNIGELVKETEPDGSINNPKILYIDLHLGNHCNLKCRMCGPFSSYIIKYDWEKIGKLEPNSKEYKRPSENKWFIHPSSINLIKESLNHLEMITFAGGEPLIIKEHVKILKMIVEENHAHHIVLNYTTNQTVIPQELLKIWKYFKHVSFHCSIEAHGPLNDYIRYPSRWSNLEKNIYYLDSLAEQNSNFSVLISSTFNAYNIAGIPKFLDYLREAKFKKLYRFPHFNWVSGPEHLAPSILPPSFKKRVAYRILEKIDEHKEFFLNYNSKHLFRSEDGIKILRGHVKAMQVNPTSQKHFATFIEETMAFDRLRKQSIGTVLPELNQFFAG